ncbi:MAG: hypothetical protein D8M57_14950 [Candidatus Scalindua sp. AMX11]|nr:MAG: hypothetical protein DWQ00_04710 [Candidatus Scalindua sp.]RZV69627.1 MAG: hypothetical protein EX341_15840 [Candidatus Scalindua sp. SCAELEC01]TDE64109.1 MAG: hypothetical protein D8M57_14950 [Candidatus Scalindua sp. AMX11]GJQ60145.1 MAG: hypothetical protein SCALA701_29460 [Candidatus Scalindua sp.]
MRCVYQDLDKSYRVETCTCGSNKIKIKVIQDKWLLGIVEGEIIRPSLVSHTKPIAVTEFFCETCNSLLISTIHNKEKDV